MSSKIDLSKELFINKYNCAQTVLAVFCEDAGIDEHTALSLACGLGGGFRRREICGAVSSAIIIIGLMCGNISPDNNIYREPTYKKIEEFLQRFEEKNGSIICKELLPDDKRPTEDDNRETQSKKYKAACSCYVEDAISILENMDFDI